MEEKKEKEEKSGFLATDLLSMLKKQLRALWVIIILLLVALVGTNMAWLWGFQSYDYVTVDSNGDAPANYIGNDGDIYNGTSESKEKEQVKGN